MDLYKFFPRSWDTAPEKFAVCVVACLVMEIMAAAMFTKSFLTLKCRRKLINAAVFVHWITNLCSVFFFTMYNVAYADLNFDVRINAVWSTLFLLFFTTSHLVSSISTAMKTEVFLPRRKGIRCCALAILGFVLCAVACFGALAIIVFGRNADMYTQNEARRAGRLVALMIISSNTYSITACGLSLLSTFSLVRREIPRTSMRKALSYKFSTNFRKSIIQEMNVKEDLPCMCGNVNGSHDPHICPMSSPEHYRNSFYCPDYKLKNEAKKNRAALLEAQALFLFLVIVILGYLPLFSFLDTDSSYRIIFVTFVKLLFDIFEYNYTYKLPELLQILC